MTLESLVGQSTLPAISGGEVDLTSGADPAVGLGLRLGSGGRSPVTASTGAMTRRRAWALYTLLLSRVEVRLEACSPFISKSHTKNTRNIVMEFIHQQVALVEKQLAFVATDPVDWKTYVQIFSWVVCLFESYLLCVTNLHLAHVTLTSLPRLRQYPLYSKKEPPKALAEHFTPEVFAKSQAYGKDKAQYALISGLIKQTLESAMLHYGIYAWAWGVAESIIGRFGYGPEYEVRTQLVMRYPDTDVGSYRSRSLSCSRSSHTSHPRSRYYHCQSTRP